MNWQEAMAQIESSEFDANLNVVSGMSAFFRAADKEPAVREAYRCLRESGDLREEALDRIYDLAELEVDPRYENPNDTALAVLLWLSYFAFPDDVDIAVDYVSGAPQCWYAAKLARQLAIPPQAKGDNLPTVFGGIQSHWGPNRNWSAETVQAKPNPSGSKLRLRTHTEARESQLHPLGESCVGEDLGHSTTSPLITQYKAKIADDSFLLMSHGSRQTNSVTLRTSLSSKRRDDD